MNLPDLSIKRPVFISCLFLLVLAVGTLSLKSLGVDQFPPVNFPTISISTKYSGAGPNEIETLVSKPIEDSLSTLSGLKSLKSTNKQGISTISAEFTLDTDIKYAEQQIRDHISTVRNKLPTDAKEPEVRAVDPADSPILVLSLAANLGPAALYDLADQDVRPLLEQVKDVGQVTVVGGRKREIQVLLDRTQLKAKQISATQVVSQLSNAGKNIPAGTSRSKGKEADVRTLGEFESLKAIGATLVNFYSNEVPIRVDDIAAVKDSLEEEKTRTFVNGQQALTLSVYRRSGANTIAVVNAVKARAAKIDKEFKARAPGFGLAVLRDGGKSIQTNVDDVTESIVIGIALTVVVVFIFLGSARSTFITGLALPNSLLGAFILMAIAGYTINIMTLLALSLAVGLLIDDAIVVRENIFRHIELGQKPKQAASLGTREVTLAVVATTLVVLAVFGPVAFLQGIVGQFFRQFGLTICFAVLISLVDALTMAPMLSAYFAGNPHAARKGLLGKALGKAVDGFNHAQEALERFYAWGLERALRWPIFVLVAALAIFVLSIVALRNVPTTFIPASDTGEFQVTMDMPPGTDLESMNEMAVRIDKVVRAHPEVQRTVLTVGGSNGEPNEASIFVQLVPAKQRPFNTSTFKDRIRGEVKPFPSANPRVQDTSGVGGATEQPFNVNIVGPELDDIQAVATQVYREIKNHPALQDVDISYRPGKPELRVVLDKERGQQLGVSTNALGQELRTLIEGTVPAEYREHGKEYDIRVRLRDDQKDLKQNFDRTFVPNINNRLIRLVDVANPVETSGPATIYRQDRGRYIQISAAINPNGPGMAKAITDVRALLSTGKIKLPPGVRYEFVGQAEEFQNLIRSILIAAVLAVLFIYLILSSLYESFVIPFTIMLVLPLAACGAFYALALTGASLDIFSMIGLIMLLGIATKNGILLVDYANQKIGQGADLKTAILEAGRTRLRPILMTSVALIAGMLPVAVGLNEASKQRTSMGIAVIGGLVSSTLLTLVVIPAAYAYVERFREWTLHLFRKLGAQEA